MRLARVLGVLMLLAVASVATPQSTRGDKKKIVFLGDSITHSGEFIAILECRHMAGLRESNYLNLGLPSETVSGLSEEGHADGKFPRPDLHERLDRIFEKVDVLAVVACYGMNDGIYLPLDEGRFEKFKDGIRRLHARAKKANAGIVFVTPPVYDPVSLGKESRYDEVLEAYSAWLLQQKKDQGWYVIDVHGAMKAALADRRRLDPKFTFAKDGVHPNLAGHIVIADAILRELDQERYRPIEIDASNFSESKLFQLFLKRERIDRDAWLSHIGHKRPLPTGLPIEKAKAKAAEVDVEIREHLKTIHIE